MGISFSRRYGLLAKRIRSQRRLRSQPPAADDHHRPHRPAGFPVVDYPTGNPSDAGRKLTAFRIDPFNGNDAGTVEIEYVELFRQPPEIEAHISPSTHWCALNEKTSCCVSFK